MSYKVIVVGSGLSGKSSLVNSLLNRPFSSVYIPTGGVRLETLQIENNLYNIWDCAGNERYKGLNEAYYLGANIAIVVFNSNKFSIVEDIDDYIKVVKRLCGDIPIIVCGSRLDSMENLSILPYNRIFYFSSLTNQGINLIKSIIYSYTFKEVRLSKVNEVNDEEVVIEDTIEYKEDEEVVEKSIDDISQLDHHKINSSEKEPGVFNNVIYSPCGNNCTIL